MSDLTKFPQSDVATAYENGRRAGLAFGALALAIVAFISLLGIEKSLLAGVLAIIALRGAPHDGAAWRSGRVALVVAGAHVLTFTVILILFHDKLALLLGLLHKLS